MSTEASYLLSGFGIYTKEILNRLYQTGKYEIAEFASYGKIGDIRDNNIPWWYYPNAVSNDHPQYQRYKSSVTNQFGEWRFESVLLDFKPDIVFSIRDPWMHMFEDSSPFSGL